MKALPLARARLVLLLLAPVLASASFPGVLSAQSPYRTRRVIIAVMDGVHYGLTFGDPEHAHIPHLWNDLRPLGTYYTQFYNNGVTITMAGHSQIMTGTWQYLRNGLVRQTYPTVIHYMADQQELEQGAAAVIFGKGYYAYDPETTFPAYEGIYSPTLVQAIGESTYQDDWNTLEKLEEVMREDRPRFVLVNFGVTDHTAHSGNWPRHVGAVENADRVLWELWNAIENDPSYRGQTTLIITNDHGYQDKGVNDGFAEHGDQSPGSRHIMLLMIGPDTKPDHVVDEPAYQIDIAPTVGELLGFQTPMAQGVVLKESLVGYHGVNRGEVTTPRASRAMAMEEAAAGNALRTLADRVLRDWGDPDRLGPSVGTCTLLWGMLHAFDKTADERYRDFVRTWVARHRATAGQQAGYVAFVASELSYREAGSARDDLASLALGVARKTLSELEEGPPVKDDVPDFILRLVLAASVAEMSNEEPLWHRAEQLYFEHVRGVDDARAEAHVTQVRGSETHATPDRSSELVVAGKVLPSTDPTGPPPDQAWYLLGIAHLRGHGLPFKGEYLDDLPQMPAEVLYQSYLAVNQLPVSGALWPDIETAALSVAGIKEVNRRQTFRGGVYERMDEVRTFEFRSVRPEAAFVVPTAEVLTASVRPRVTQMNYNVKYGFPPYAAFDFTIDLLRLHLDEAQSPMVIGAFLMALDEHRRISREPFVPTPR